MEKARLKPKLYCLHYKFIWDIDNKDGLFYIASTKDKTIWVPRYRVTEEDVSRMLSRKQFQAWKNGQTIFLKYLPLEKVKQILKGTK